MLQGGGIPDPWTPGPQVVDIAKPSHYVRGPASPPRSRPVNHTAGGCLPPPSSWWATALQSDGGSRTRLLLLDWPTRPSTPCVSSSHLVNILTTYTFTAFDMNSAGLTPSAALAALMTSQCLSHGLNQLPCWLP